MTAPKPNISAIVPARNEEANIARCVASLAAQPEIAEIIIVNDQSTDRTGEILSHLKSQISNLRVVEITAAPPEDWTGKNWAISQGVTIANGEWLLFADADVTLLHGAAAHAVSDAASQNAVLVSYSPEQEMRTWWERAVIPFIFCRLAAHFSYARINDPAQPDAAANGQFLLISREAYNAAGGHAAVAEEIVEDVALAHRVKQSGRRIFFAPGRGIVRTRMYRSFGAMWEGWKKNLYLLMGHSTGAVLRELLVVVPWIPLLLLLLGFVHKLLPVVGLLLLLGRHIGYALELSRNRFPLSGILYYLAGVFCFTGALLASAQSYQRGRVSWKGRKYSTGAD